MEWKALRDPVSPRLRLGYGYATTVDTAQGSTVGEAILAMPAGSSGLDVGRFYVGMSRHRETVWLVVAEGADRREVARRRPIGNARPIRAGDLWALVAFNLGRAPETAGALAFLERAHAVRDSATAVFQVGLARLEKRSVQGAAATVVPHRARLRRIASVLAPVAAWLSARVPALAALASPVAPHAKGEHDLDHQPNVPTRKAAPRRTSGRSPGRAPR